MLPIHKIDQLIQIMDGPAHFAATIFYAFGQVVLSLISAFAYDIVSYVLRSIQF
jgi:hypothetical protein